MHGNRIFCNIKIGIKALLILLFVLAGSACFKEANLSDVDLPGVPVLSIQSKWGVVVNIAYTQIFQEPSKKSEQITTLRKNYIVEVLSSTARKDTHDNIEAYWYKIVYEGYRGWVFGGYLAVFDSKQQATNAAKENK